MIKNWKKFNEGKQLDLFQNTPYAKPELIHQNFYPIDEDDILDYLTEIEDAKYIIGVKFGFYKNDDYTELIDSYKVRPCISVVIGAYYGTESYDVTSCLTSFSKRVKPKFKEVKIRDSGGYLDINNIQLKDGEIIKSDGSRILGDLEILLIWFEDISLTDKMIYDHYGFPVDRYTTFTNKGKALIDVPMDRLSDWILPRGSSYQDIIDDPDYDIYSWYDGGEWLPDHNSFFEYTLENETIEILLRCCFKNFSELKDEHPEFLEEYDSLEDFIQKITKPKNRWSDNWSELGRFLDREEPAGNIYNEIRVTYADWSMTAKAESDYKEIINEFDKSVVDLLETTIVEKPEYEETKRVRKLDSNGESFWKESTYMRIYYKLEFNIGWLYQLDSDALFNLESVEDKIGEYVSSYHYETKDLNPNFSDYGYVDNKEFNKETRSVIKYQMEIK
jgi:hypothetical protein